MKKILLALGAVLALASCKQVEFKNGEIPDEYLSEAKKLEGTYMGSFAGLPYDLEIQFEGNKPRIAFRSPDGNGCRFAFGDVLAADVSGSKDDYTIKRVYFELQSESCYRAEGKTIQLDLSEKDGRVRMDAYILQEEHWERVCHWEYPPGRPGYPPPPAQYVCHDELMKSYLNGRFIK